MEPYKTTGSIPYCHRFNGSAQRNHEDSATSWKDMVYVVDVGCRLQQMYVQEVLSSVVIKCDWLHFMVGGVKPSNPAALGMARNMASCDFVSFAGVYTHCGQSYDCSGEEEHVKIACHARDETVKFAKQYVEC